ncbi:ArsA family ATPase [Streptomyces armeniacus]|uniref:ArsA family ATPase n=1 Tax=Streptomyces armeniacus TaxID=83291 RepID=A0A345XLU9_9ACTN|nr:ArsA-related P-loop ATPase [Streptomyces armeniacus]AXK32615.1 ArsA family ATPase [Streptomyces armeniacus]
MPDDGPDRTDGDDRTEAEEARTDGDDRTEAAPAVRTVLVTGAGGSGRTTVAAATALRAARGGARTLLLSTAPDGVLEAVLDAPLAPAYGAEDAYGPLRPAAVDGVPGLWAARVDPDEDFRAQALAVQRHARAALEFTGSEPLAEDELTTLPGAGTFALLRALRAAGGTDGSTGPAWDVVVADLPPAPEALAALALPEQLRRYLRRLLPPEKQAARALRPVLAQLAGVPMPAEWLYGATARWERELAGVQRVIDAAGTSVRLVTEPGGALAVAALRAVRPALALYGLRVDAVVANRVLPTGSPDEWLAALSGRQQAVLKELREAAGDAPLTELPHLGREPRGPHDLAALPAPAVRGMDAEPGSAAAVEDRLAEEGLLHWRLPLPGAGRDALGLVRRGDELTVGVGPYRRTLPLPSVLRRCRVTGAALADGELRVRFAPEPGLWPRAESGQDGG